MAEIVMEIERLCIERGRTSDPIKVREIDCELEYLNGMIEEGVCE